jgi:hypothetical protein
VSGGAGAPPDTDNNAMSARAKSPPAAMRPERSNAPADQSSRVSSEARPVRVPVAAVRVPVAAAVLVLLLGRLLDHSALRGENERGH